MNKDSFTVALESSYLKGAFYRSKMDRFDIYYRVVMVFQGISDLHLNPYFQWEYLFYWEGRGCEGLIDHSQLALSSTCFLFVTIAEFNSIVAFPCLLLVEIFCVWGGVVVIVVLIKSMHGILSKLCVTLLWLLFLAI